MMNSGTLWNYTKRTLVREDADLSRGSILVIILRTYLIDSNSEAVIVIPAIVKFKQSIELIDFPNDKCFCLLCFKYEIL